MKIPLQSVQKSLAEPAVHELHCDLCQHTIDALIDSDTARQGYEYQGWVSMVRARYLVQLELEQDQYVKPFSLEVLTAKLKVEGKRLIKEADRLHDTPAAQTRRFVGQLLLNPTFISAQTTEVT